MAFPDREMELVDGELVERSSPNNTHSRTQGRLFSRFDRLADRLRLFPRTELRLRVAPARYRVVDLAVYTGEEPVAEVPSEPPFVAIEIVSPDDTYAGIMERLQDYHDWGVRHVWLLDPQSRRFSAYGAEGLQPVAALELPELGVRITPEEIFS
jgi:Uma2 family endonuclease